MSGSALRRRALLWALGASLAPLAGLVVQPHAEDAVANGDTRTLTIFHVHTRETTTATFRVNGRYDPAALEKLNWALRDWRRDEPTKIDPKLFDVAWEVQREVGSSQPIQILSAFRSPETNAMLRRRSRLVAEYSQHMLGKAMDVHFTDASMAQVRDIAMRLQRGGVGYYPTSGTPFVHMDVGGVRYWPRMSRPELARIFPDGKTVDIPADGKPMERYQEALAEIQARGGTAEDATETDTPKSKNLLAMLFGGGDGDAPAAASTAAPAAAITPAVPASARAQIAENVKAAENNPAADAPIIGPQTAALTTDAAAPAAAEPERTADVPVPVAKPRVLAENDTTLSDADKVETATVPLPPSRPAEIEAPVVVAAADVPVPPERPAELGAAHPVTPAPDAASGKSAASGKNAEDAARGDAARLALTAKSAKLAAMARSADAQAAPAKRSDGKLTVVAIPSAHLAARVPLPNVITQGADRPTPEPSVLAFAETPATRGLQQAAAGTTIVPAQARRHPAFVAARIDRSNFRTLTAAAPTERATSYTAQGVGSAMAPMRAAAQTQRQQVAAMNQGNEVVTTFAPRAPYGDLKCGSFTGPAVKGLTVADRFSTVE